MDKKLGGLSGGNRESQRLTKALARSRGVFQKKTSEELRSEQRVVDR